jgi:hypothetical protein
MRLIEIIFIGHSHAGSTQMVMMAAVITTSSIVVRLIYRVISNKFKKINCTAKGRENLYEGTMMRQVNNAADKKIYNFWAKFSLSQNLFTEIVRS